MNRTIFVTQPHLPPLDDFLPLLRKIWDTRVLTNGGPFHQQFEQALCVASVSGRQVAIVAGFPNLGDSIPATRRHALIGIERGVALGSQSAIAGGVARTRAVCRIAELAFAIAAVRTCLVQLHETLGRASVAFDHVPIGAVETQRRAGVRVDLQSGGMFKTGCFEADCLAATAGADLENCGSHSITV